MVGYRQEVPPQEGFEKIEWAKRIPKRTMGGIAQIAGFVGITTTAWVFYAMFRKKHRKLELEMRDARIAIEPFLRAERDRAILKHYRVNREEENELMKDVKGWKTGTLWGEPVYHNVRDRYIEPSLEELLAHMKSSDKRNFMWDKLWR